MRGELQQSHGVTAPLSLPRSRRLLRFAATSIFLASLAVFLLIAVLPRTGAYETLTVLSGSMRPTFGPGDLVIARPTSREQIRVGDVLVYHIPVGDHHVESHRVVAIVSRHPKLVVMTKGDANKARDPWRAVLHGNRLWVVRGVVPYAGFAILWLRDPLVHRLATFLVPAFLALLLLWVIWSRPDAEHLPSKPDAVRKA